MASSVAAQSLQFPSNATLQFQSIAEMDSYAMPIDIWAEGELPAEIVEGMVTQQAWRIDAQTLTTLQLLRPLRDQLRDDRYQIVFECQTEACGGFDFRFATETLPGPNMYVNIRAFHFVTAIRPSGDIPDEVITILASTSATSAYVQIIQAGKLVDGSVAVATTADLPTTSQPISPQRGVLGSLTDQLLSKGHVILPDLDFATGTSDLGRGPFVSLDTLAAFLNEQPAMRVALVGHTDSVGGLDGNITLSRKRAQSVRSRLIEAYGVDAARMDAQGMGYLAPVASNLGADGREANRRVEVIILSAE